jgi:hypothetical protein
MDEELLKLIAEMTADQSVKDNLTTQVKSAMTAQAQKLTKDYKNKDDEALKLKRVLKEVGYDHTVHGDYDTFVADVLSKGKKTEETEVTLNGVNSKVSDLTSKLEDALSKVNVITDERNRFEKESATNKVRSALTDKLKGKVKGDNFIIDSILSNNETVIEGNNISFKTGDTTVGIDSFVDTLLENNKDVVINPQKNGTDAKGGDLNGEPQDMIAKMKSQMRNV